jgi:4-coumarate--CoA ligase (photoactive yellow protein activation family)
MLQLGSHDLWRVLRDLVFSEVGRTPALAGWLSTLGTRSAIAALDLGEAGLNADSLLRVQLATAVATQFNTFDVGLEDLLLAKTQVHDWIAILQRARAAGACDITFSSSGTTGQKKYLRHAEQTLWEEAQVWAKQLEHVNRVVVMCPVHHIYGFIWGVLVPLVLKVPVVELDQTQSDQWRANDLVVAVPNQWDWLAPKFARRTPPTGMVGISSTSPMSNGTRQLLRDHGPSQFFEIYGSSETAGIGARAIAKDHYELIACRVRQQDQVFMCEPRQLTRPLELRSNALTIQDELCWLSETRFELGHRNDGVVQIAGHNVSPDWVVQQITQHKLVKESSVRLDALATPPRLKAFVVLHEPAQTKNFEQWLANQLPHYALPHKIDYGQHLPRNAIGKLSDWG